MDVGSAQEARTGAAFLWDAVGRDLEEVIELVSHDHASTAIRGAPEFGNTLDLGREVLTLARRTFFTARINQERLASVTREVLPRLLEDRPAELSAAMRDFTHCLAPITHGMVDSLLERQRAMPGNAEAYDDLQQAYRLAALVAIHESRLPAELGDLRGEAPVDASPRAPTAAAAVVARARGDERAMEGRGESAATAPASEMDQKSGSYRKTVFIVHGHDVALKEAVARVLEKAAAIKVVILHERPDGGKTIMEKFERHAQEASFAVVLLAPDDRVGDEKGMPSEFRARQNVILELGYFVGKLGRAHVCALRKGDVSLPGDYLGVLYKPVDEGGAWRYELAKELREAGILLDLNLL